MATNYFPLIANATANTINELPAGDNLDLTGSNIANVENINTVGNVYFSTTNTGLQATQNYSASFNGTDQYLNAPVAANTGPSQPFTVEAWVYNTAFTGVAVMAMEDGAHYYGFGFSNGDSGAPNVPGPYLYVGVFPSWQQVISPISSSLNTWYHIAATFDGTTTRLFQNGVLVASGSISWPDQTSLTPTMYIGRRWDTSSSTYFAGKISNFRYVLGTAVYTTNFTPPTTLLTSTQLANINGNPSNAIPGTQTQLLTLQNSTIVDNSSYGLTITNINGVTTSTTSILTGPSFLSDGTQWQSTSIAITGNANVTGNTNITGNANIRGNVYTPTINTGLVAHPSASTYYGDFTAPGYITVSTPGFNFGTSNFTVEGWFYPSSSVAAVGFWGQDTGGGPTPKFCLYSNGTDIVLNVENGISISAPTSSLTLNAWNHIAIVRNGLGASDSAMYVNGVNVSTGIISSDISDITASFNVGYLGEGYPSSSALFPGYISNFRVVIGIAVYTTNFTPSTVPLTSTQLSNVNGYPSNAITAGQTYLLTLQNSTLIDNSSYAYSLTTTGTVTTSSTIPVFPPQTSLLYDGTQWQSTPIQTTGLTVDVGNLHVSGGSSGYVLSTDGAGNLSWSSGGGGGGATGATGATGASGIDGATGATGLEGATGASGIDGATGATGLEGATGSSGIDGATGATGEFGSTGATGETGSTGLTGATGETGATGASGIDGATGASGIDGATGASGLDGSTGATGETGSTGSSGIDGATGATGEFGSTGATGPQGSSSSLFLYLANTGSTSGYPGDGDLLWNNATQIDATQINVSHLTDNGVDVDIFLAFIQATETITIQDQNSSANYQTFTVSGAPTNINPGAANSYWTIPVVIQSSAGTGTTNFANAHDLFLAIVSGVTGATGATGVGATGASGLDGASGATGSSGIDGATGASGIAGATGASGIDGATGASGIAGATGASGIDGATGATGPVAGSNTQVIFNDDNAAGASANLTFNKATNLLTVIGDINSSGNGIFGNSTGQVSITPDVNGGIEIGNISRSTAGTPFIDFHSSNFGVDYDVRLIASGGSSGIDGAGNLTTYTYNFNASGNFNVVSGIISGDGAGISNIAVANVVGLGNVALANFDGSSANVLYGNGVFAPGGGGGGANIANGNSNVTVVANSNVTISVTSVPNVVVVTSTGMNIAGTINTGSSNVTANYFIGNGSQLTGITVSGGTSIINGTSNISIPVANANITMSVAGNPNTIVVTSTGAELTGNMTISNALTVTGNAAAANVLIGAGTGGAITGANSITANYFVGNGSLITGITLANGNSNVNVPTANGNVTISVTGTSNVVTITNTGVNVVGTLNTGVANITANYYIGNGSQLTGISATTTIANGNSNVSIPVANGNVNISAVGNANVLIVTGTGANILGTTNVAGNLAVTGTFTLGSGAGGNISNVNVLTANTFAQGNSNITIVSNANVNFSITGTANIASITAAGIITTVGNGAITSNAHTASGVATGNSNVSTITGNLGFRSLFTTYTEGNAAAAATIANAAIHAFAAPNLAAANTTVTFTNAATMYIAGGPVANTNATITNSYALMVAGNARFFGNIIGPVANGNSNVYIATANGNVTIAAVGNTTLTVTGTGANITGTANITGNLSAGNIPIIPSGNSNITITSNANISMFTVGNATAQFVVATSGVNVAGYANAVNMIGNSHTAQGTVSANLNIGNAIVLSTTGLIGNVGMRGIFTTYTDNTAAASSTVANAAIHGLAQPNIAATNTAVTFTNAATFLVGGAPVANTNATITNPYSVWVANGNSRFDGGLRVNSATGFGYSSTIGANTQLTSRNTAVTISNVTGAITLFSSTTTANTINVFTVTNTTVAAADTIILNQRSGNTSAYQISVSNVAAGSFQVQIYNYLAVGVAEAPVLNFAVLKTA